MSYQYGAILTDVIVEGMPVYVGKNGEFTVFTVPNPTAAPTLEGLGNALRDASEKREADRTRRIERKKADFDPVVSIGDRKAYIIGQGGKFEQVVVRGRNARTRALLVTMLSTGAKIQLKYGQAILMSDEELARVNELTAKRDELGRQLQESDKAYEVEDNEDRYSVEGLPPEVVYRVKKEKGWGLEERSRRPLKVLPGAVLACDLTVGVQVTAPNTRELERAIVERSHPLYGESVYVLSRDKSETIEGPIPYRGSVSAHAGDRGSYSICLVREFFPFAEIRKVREELAQVNAEMKGYLSNRVEV